MSGPVEDCGLMFSWGMTTSLCERMACAESWSRVQRSQEMYKGTSCGFEHTEVKDLLGQVKGEGGIIKRRLGAGQ